MRETGAERCPALVMERIARAGLADRNGTAVRKHNNSKTWRAGGSGAWGSGCGPIGDFPVSYEAVVGPDNGEGGDAVPGRQAGVGAVDEGVRRGEGVGWSGGRKEVC